MEDEKMNVSKQLEFIKGTALNQMYSHMNNISKLSEQGIRTRRIDRNTIRKAMADPYKNVTLLQQASELFKVTSGIYARVINYQSNILTNYHTISPYNINKIKTPEKLQKAYMETAMFLQKYNIIRTAPWIYNRTISQGELYLYKIEDNNGLITMEIPSNLCKITSVSNDVSRYAVSLTKLTKSSVKAMPLEIQKAYESLQNKVIKKSDLIDNEYFEIGDNGIAFSLNRYKPKSVPFYASIFDDLMELEDMKDLKSSTAVIDNLKIIHQQLPTDKSSGDVLMDFDVAQAYHRDTASKVPTGTTVVTNPMPMNTVTLADGNSKVVNNVRDSIDNIYDGAGVSVEIFNANRASNEAIACGIMTDSLVALEIQRMIAAWINYELLTKNKKNGIWQIKFIEGMTHYNKDSYIKLAREDMSFAADKSMFFACRGLTPLEVINTLKMEQMLGIDDLMTPVQSSHTSSSGRPSKEDAGNDSGQSTKPLEE